MLSKICDNRWRNLQEDYLNSSDYINPLLCQFHCILICSLIQGVLIYFSLIWFMVFILYIRAYKNTNILLCVQYILFLTTCMYTSTNILPYTQYIQQCPFCIFYFILILIGHMLPHAIKNM